MTRCRMTGARLVFLLYYLWTGVVTGNPDEKRLINSLLEGYNPYVRPVNKFTDKVNVSLQLMELEIVELDEKTQTLKTSGWLRQSWLDPQLIWNRTAFPDIDVIRLPVESIWRPDIVLINNAADTFRYVLEEVNLAVITRDGMVLWVPHVRLRSECKLVLTHFPHDIQRCDLNFGSWTYDFSKIDIHLKQNVSKTFHVQSKEWDVLTYSSGRTLLAYGTKDSDKAPMITYSLKMARQSAYLKHIFTIPPLALAILITCQFLIPPETGERMFVGVGSLLGIVLQMLLLQSYLPNEMTDLPAPALYLSFLTVISTLSLLVSIGVFNCHYRDIRKGKVPAFLRSMCLGGLGRIFCMKGDAYAAVPSDAFDATFDPHTELRVTDDRPLPNSPTLALEKTLEEIKKYLKICATKSETPEYVTHRQLVLNEWHQVALVIDRLAFFVVSMVTALVTAVIYIR